MYHPESKWELLYQRVKGIIASVQIPFWLTNIQSEAIGTLTFNLDRRSLCLQRDYTLIAHQPTNGSDEGSNSLILPSHK